MRQSLVLGLVLFFGLVASILAQSVAYNTPIITITAADKSCDLPGECTFTETTCCDTSCVYDAVNKTMQPNYVTLLANTRTRSCANIDCPQILTPCAVPEVTCRTSSSLNTRGSCGIVQPVAHPTPAAAEQCKVVPNTGNNCENMCVPSSYLGPAVVCDATDPVAVCRNTCHSRYARCGTSSVNPLRRQTGASPCDFIATSNEYGACLEQCVAPTPVDTKVPSEPRTETPAVEAPIQHTSTSTPTCVVAPDFNNGCESSCVLSDSVDSSLACRPSDPVVLCRNGCHSQYAQCSRLSVSSSNSVCGFVSNSQEYGACLEACSVRAPVHTPDADTPAVVASAPTCAVTRESSTCRAHCGLSGPSNTIGVVCEATGINACLNLCDSTHATCSSTASSGVNQAACQFVPRDSAAYTQCYEDCRSTEPPPTVPSPQTTPSTCGVTYNSNCESQCQPRNGLAVESMCEPRDPLVACSNACKSRWTTCGESDSTLTNSQCAFTFTDRVEYTHCIDACRPQTPAPAVVSTCNERYGEDCLKVCSSDPALGVAIECTGDALTQCLNECTRVGAVCSPTSNGCAYVPRLNTEYQACAAACRGSTAPSTHVEPKQCFKTGCNGDICSSTQVVSICAFQETCESRCYHNAECGFNADGQCGWTLTESVRLCLAACVPVVPAPKPVVDECKISGCQRELCVPASTADYACPAIYIEPTCETKCLQHAVCGRSDFTLNSAGVANTLYCGWGPNPNAPSAYGECLQACTTPTEPCFVSGCGGVCSDAANTRHCTEDLVAQDCHTRCRIANTECSLTNTGCNFVPKVTLQACIDACPPVTNVPEEEPVGPCAVNSVACITDPCDFASCPAFPDAICHSDRCGDCRAVWTINDRVVDCNADCSSLRCNDCISKPGCHYCSGTYATENAIQGFGMCVAAHSDYADRCVAENGRLLASGATCPNVSPGDDGIRSETGDATSIQNEVASGRDLPVREKFIIVITLVVNETNIRSDGLQLVKMFVDLIGVGTPSSTDKEEVCTILKEALVKVDSRIDGVDLVRCELEEKLSVKRDASYVADMTFQGMSSAGVASALSAAVGLLGLVAYLF